MRRLTCILPALAFVMACGGSAAPAPKAVTQEATVVPTTAAPAPPPAPPEPVAAAAPPTAPARPAGPASRPTKISARHVLIQWMGCQNAAPSVVRTRDQAHSVAEEVLRRARAGEDFARLAIQFSDEPNAGARGGSLGRFGHGAMVKEFEEAAFGLAAGEISGIVESPFGFHVIQRTE